MLARLCTLFACLLALILTPLVSIAAQDTSAEANPTPAAIYQSAYSVITPDNVDSLTPVVVLSHSDHEGYNWYNALYKPSWSPDGRYVAAIDTGSEGETPARGVWLYDVTDLDSPPRLFEHSGILVGYSFSPDSVWLATITHPGYEGGKMIVWDVESGEPQFEFGGVMDIMFSPDRTRMVSRDVPLFMWDTMTFQEISRLRDVCYFDFNSMMTMVAVVDCFNYPSVLSLYDVKSGQPFFVGEQAVLQAVDLSHDLRLLATMDNRGTVKLWGLAPGVSDTFLISGEDYIRDAARVRFSPDGAVLASWTSGGGTIHLWSVETGSHVAALEGHAPPGYDSQGGVDLQVAYAPNSQLLAATWEDGVTEDENTRLWDARSGELLLTLPEELGARFSPDGTMVLTDSTDGTIKIWAVDDSS
jgi:WD40 repeat protein